MDENPHRKSFFEEFSGIGMTFDDVSLITQYADFLPDEANIGSRLTRNVKLNIPFVAAAMDTVTEAEMAIAMALDGGVGIIHRNLSARRQAKHVSRVKHYLNGLISEPVTYRDDQTLQMVHENRVARGFTFSGFPILDADDKVVGILTSADIKFCRDPSARIADVMTRQVISAPPTTTLQQAYELMQQNKIGKLPLLEDGKLVGLYSYTDVQILVEQEEPMYNRDADHRLRVGAAVGARDEQRVEQLADVDVDVIVVDTAHGHSKAVVDMVRWCKKQFPEVDIVAGNIATGEAAVALRDAGADAVKVGIGPGSICTTRVVAGVGVPQVTAIYHCAQALEGSIPVIADGGIRNSGDVPKAIAAGADSVMMGSVLASTDESPGEKIIHQGRQYVVYRGMGSLAALRASEGSRDRYRQSGIGAQDLVPEGIEGIVPYSGPVAKVLTQYAGGLRSALGYCGCRTIEEMHRRAGFMRISSAGMLEGHPHDVKIMKEAPNYRS